MVNQYFVLLVLSLGIFGKMNRSCPKKTGNTNPHLLYDHPSIMHGPKGTLFVVTCCFDGFTKIYWNYRDMNQNEWISVDKNSDLSDSNRSLYLYQPQPYDAGFYRCRAEDNFGRLASHTIFLYFLRPDEKQTITIIRDKSSQKSDYDVEMNVSLNCTGRSFIPSIEPVVKWLYKRNDAFGPINRDHKINTTILKASDRLGETNPDQVDIYSILLFNNAKVTDKGYYKCVMIQGKFSDQQKFYISVLENRIPWEYITSVSIAIVLIVGISAVLWFKRFNIMIMYKTYFVFVPTKSDKRFDISVLYEDDTDYIVQSTLTITNKLEKYNFRCWHFDRDKIYGQETLLDQSQVMAQSHTVLVLISQSAIHHHNLLTNLSTMQPDPSIKRLYIFIPNRKVIFQSLDETNNAIKRWLKKELYFQFSLQPHSFDWEILKSGKPNTLLSWIIASLPSSQIQIAKRKHIQSS